MWPFNRRKKSDQEDKVPAEVQEYYESEHRERVGLAWLIAFVTLVITVLIIIALFFGGRWLYRKIAHKDNTKSPSTSQNQPVQSTPSSTSQNASNGQASSGSSSSNSPQSSSSSSAQSSNTSGGQASSTSTNQPSSATNTQSSNGKITNTGPGNTIAIFVAVSILGTLLHMGYTKYKMLNREKI